jgi:hypothetical protein
MKSTEIHKGLPEKEIRDFFANSLSEIYDKECANKKVEIPYHERREDIFKWVIKDAENEIVVLNRRIEITYQKIAILSLIKERGWEEHDVSDMTINDTNHKLWLNFIGTKKEFEFLQLLINGD